MLQELAGLDLAQVRGTAERVARRGDVVVPEHDVRPVARVQPRQLAGEDGDAALAADQVAGDGDEVELLPGRPGRRPSSAPAR